MELYSHTNGALARGWIDRLSSDVCEDDYPIEVQSLGRTLKRAKEEIVAWSSAQVTNGPIEAMNNLIKKTNRPWVFRLQTLQSKSASLCRKT